MDRLTSQHHATRLTLAAGTATRLIGSGASRPTGARATLTVRNSSGGSVFVGGPDVDQNSGFTLPNNETMTVPASVGGLFGYSVAGGTVELLEGF